MEKFKLLKARVFLNQTIKSLIKNVTLIVLKILLSPVVREYVEYYNAERVHTEPKCWHEHLYCV
jgi:hypothetical protein